MKIYNLIIALLDEHNVNYRVVSHVPEGRCEVISAIRGNIPSQAMKAIVIRAQKSKKQSDYYLAVLPGDHLIDMDALKAYAKAPVFFAPAPKALQLTDCEMGAVPPFTFNPDVKLIVDPSIQQNDEIVFNAGLLDKSIFMRTCDYITLSGLTWLDFTKQDSVAKTGLP